MGQLVCAAANDSEAISNKVKVENRTGLDENDPHSRKCLNTWSLAHGIVWRGLRGMALLEKVPPWE